VLSFNVWFLSCILLLYLILICYSYSPMMALNGLHYAAVLLRNCSLTHSLNILRPLFKCCGCYSSCSCCGQNSHCSPHICVKITDSTILWLTKFPPTRYRLKEIVDYNLRNSNYSYVLPRCKLNVFKRSFINWCLFSF